MLLYFRGFTSLRDLVLNSQPVGVNASISVNNPLKSWRYFSRNY